MKEGTMKLTKATLKSLIKEELLKEARIESARSRMQRALTEEDMMQEAENLGTVISNFFDVVDLDKGTLVADIDRMYQNFRDLLLEFVGEDG